MNARGARRLLWLTVWVVLAVMAARRPLMLTVWAAATALLVLVPVLLLPAATVAGVLAWSALRHHDGGRLWDDQRVISQYAANDL